LGPHCRAAVLLPSSGGLRASRRIRRSSARVGSRCFGSDAPRRLRAVLRASRSKAGERHELPCGGVWPRPPGVRPVETFQAPVRRDAGPEGTEQAWRTSWQWAAFASDSDPARLRIRPSHSAPSPSRLLARSSCAGFGMSRFGIGWVYVLGAGLRGLRRAVRRHRGQRALSGPAVSASGWCRLSECVVWCALVLEFGCVRDLGRVGWGAVKGTELLGLSSAPGSHVAGSWRHSWAWRDSALLGG
jgi:hypothetical protein